MPANPFLQDWRALGETKRLEAMRWPRDADKQVSGRAYAAHFWDAVANIPQRPVRARAVERAQHDSIAQRLKTNFLYPILFGEE